tara:strand:+ start:641 stop:1231 length:591 start_codon:yes stop_codon:yes gene_type:complete
MLWSLLVGINTLAAVLLLYICWRYQFKYKSVLILFCWSALLAGPWLFKGHNGIEFSLVYVALYICCTAWSLSLYNSYVAKPSIAKTRTDKKSSLASQVFKSNRVAMHRYRWANIPTHIVNLVLVLPFAGTVAMVISMSIFGFIGLNKVNAMVLSALIMPLLWGAFAYWTISSQRKSRPLVLLSILACFSAFSLFGL